MQEVITSIGDKVAQTLKQEFFIREECIMALCIKPCHLLGGT